MKLAAIVLAAGKGERFGGGKLAAPLAGKPLLDHAVDIALASPADRVIVVARPDGQPVDHLRAVQVDLASAGLAASLRAGVAAAGDVDGALVFLGDMPLVPTDMAARLIAAIGDGLAALPTWHGKPGHPVLLGRRAFTLVEGLEGDEGLGRVLRGREDVVRLAVAEEGVVLDVDSVADLAEIAQRMT
ncbi:MAG: nucleotidyltransferase family protein [Novosphingobium sp.]